MEMLFSILARGVYATLRFNMEQLAANARRTPEEEVLFIYTRETVDMFEKYLGMSVPAGTDQDQRQEQRKSDPINVGMKGILDQIREGEIPVNTSEEPDGILTIGHVGNIEITEDDDVVDIISPSRPDPKIIPINRK